MDGYLQAELAVIRQTLAQLTHVVANQHSPLIGQLTQRQIELEKELLRQSKELQRARISQISSRPALGATGPSRPALPAAPATPPRPALPAKAVAPASRPSPAPYLSQSWLMRASPNEIQRALDGEYQGLGRLSKSNSRSLEEERRRRASIDVLRGRLSALGHTYDPNPLRASDVVASVAGLVVVMAAFAFLLSVPSINEWAWRLSYWNWSPAFRAPATTSREVMLISGFVLLFVGIPWVMWALHND